MYELRSNPCKLNSHQFLRDWNSILSMAIIFFYKNAAIYDYIWL